MQKQLKQTFFGEYLLYGHISLWRGDEGFYYIAIFFLREILLWENHIHFFLAWEEVTGGRGGTTL